MQRRKFIIVLGGVILTWPFAVRAQQAMPVIGFLNPTSPDASAPIARISQGLKDSGYIDGENVAIVYRWAEDQFEEASMRRLFFPSL